MKLSGKIWIGADSDVCADSRGAICSVTQLAHVRPDGARVAMGLPMDQVFFERIEFPKMDWQAAEKLVTGKFDLKIPVPIEKCLVYARPVRTSPEPLFLAFAVTREAYKAHLSAFRAAIGCDPEAVLPSAEALAGAVVRHLGGGKPSALLLHAAADKWTLLAVENGVLSGVVTLAGDDTSGAMRNAKILAMRFETPPTHFLVSGAGAVDELAERLAGMPNALPCHVEVVPDPTSFLAAALAHLGASRETDGGFRRGDLAHPACHRRALRTCLQMGLAPLAFALAACALAAAVHVRSSTRLTAWNERLDQAAARIANGPLPQHGRAAAERAKGLFDWRNPALASRTTPSALDALPTLVEAAATRGLTFSGLDYDGCTLHLSGHGAVEADMTVLRLAAARAGFAFEARTEARADGVGFTATVATQNGGEP
jgi:hypothetical protein